MTTAHLLLIVLAGWGLTLLLEWLLVPQSQLLARPFGAHAIHLGLWLLLFGVPLMLIQHPMMLLAIALSFWILVVAVNNNKNDRLREPLIFTDLEFLSYAVQHPRLYIPFIDPWWALFVGLVSTGVVYGLWRLDGVLETPAYGAEHVFVIAGMGTLSLLLLWSGTRLSAVPTMEPAADVRRSGLLANLWLYRAAARRPRVEPLRTPFHTAKPQTSVRPDIIAVQSESFFDARRMFGGVRPDVLEQFDALRREVASAEGRLLVPAWGANTVRTEFSFLSGVASEALGIDRFNPYRALAREPLATVAAYLRGLGYRTVCVHPYLSSFYARDEVFPNLGFDEFIDVRSFSDDDRFGPFVSDAAVANTVVRLIDGSDRPTFVFAITMENHGPLHLEPLAADESAAYLSEALSPVVAHDLAVYLRHLKNADRMLARFRGWLDSRSRPGYICFYGDHVPIMPAVYKEMSPEAGYTDYVIWGSGTNGARKQKDLGIEKLGPLLLSTAGLMKN